MSILRTKPYLVLIIVLFGVLSCIPYVWSQPINFTLDFEKGDLRSWKSTGNAFDYQPTLGDNPTARHRGQPSRHQGRYWIGTYEKYQGLRGQKPGSIQGDKPQGTLTSSPFTIPSGTLSFLIGGGKSFKTRAELLIIEGTGEFNQKRVLYASGRNTETMQRVKWDLSPYAGKTGQIRIVDVSSGGWGHINVDDFRFAPVQSEVDSRLYLSLAGNPPFHVDKPVKFKVRIEPDYPDLQYRYDFGDGIVSAWVREDVVQHEYSEEGTYQVFVLARRTIQRERLTRIPRVVTVKSNTATIKVQRPTPQTRVYLKTDRDRIRTGERVRFETAIKPPYRNVEYQFVFGDGRRSDWMREPEIVHAYENEGTYRAIVRVRVGRERVVKSNPVTIAVKRPSKPVAKIYPTHLKVVQGEKVVFESRSTHATDGWLKEYWTGPGEQTGRGRSFEVNTKELNPGKYVITLDIVDNHKQSGRTVAALEILPPPVEHRATIEADRNRLEQDQSVRFKAFLSPEVPDAEYRFIFGDGMESDWTGGAGIEHLYSSHGLYRASVIVRKGKEIIAKSREVRIEVIPAPVEVTNFRLLLDVGQNRTGPGESVTFRTTLKPYTEGAEYQFVFGDGESSEWGSKTIAEHIYPKPGTYSAYVIARLAQKIISKSKPVMVDVAAPFPLRRWAVVIAGLLIAFGGYYLFAKINRPKKIKGHPESTIKVHPQKDIGSQQIKASASIQSDFELRLRAVTDKGNQVIKSEDPLIPGRGEE